MGIGPNGEGPPVGRVLAALAGLAILAYLPVFWQPFVADDFVQIGLAREYGPASGWAALSQDPLYRSRATSLVLTWWTERLLGFTPLTFYSTSVLLHILNTWLVFALGSWPAIGWRAAAVAGAFFAVHEGHQEAVMWYAALPELLVFFWVLLSLACWGRWLGRGASAGWYVASLGCFLLALFSKESAVVTAPLPLVLGLSERAAWRKLAAAAPFAAIAVAYMAMIFASQTGHGHFSDGTFSLETPFLTSWANSYGRLLWIWGAASLLALAAWRAWRRAKLVWLALVWIAITLAPYSFLTYMLRVPSRHTYLASLGLAWLVAAAALELRERWGAPRRWAVPAVAAVIVAHNVAYLWIKKRAQYLERAAPTEKLVELARRVEGPIYVHCFPYGYEIAERAMEMVVGKPKELLLFGPAADYVNQPAAIYCGGHRVAEGKSTGRGQAVYFGSGASPTHR